MTTKEYQDHPAENYSGLKHLLTSIPHFIANRGRTTTATPAMQMGTWLHDWVLLGIMPNVAIKPEYMSFATKEGKEWREEANKAGVPIIDDADWKILERRVAAVRASKVAMKALAAAPDREKPLFGDLDRIPVKARFDAVGIGSFLDIKTCQDASEKAFGEVICKYHYDFQFALYEHIWKQNYQGNPAFHWIAISADENPVVAVFKAGPFASTGAEKLDIVKKRILFWLNHGEPVLEPEIPYWVAREMMQ